MEGILFRDIRDEAESKALEYQYYHNLQHVEFERRTKTIQNPAVKVIKTPSEWSVDRKYNPFYVRKHAKRIAKSISRKILEGKYKPALPIQRTVKKQNGTRKISVYQIPDSAVSDRFYKNLLAKNKHRLSSLSYAYRNDRNVHFAIQDIANEIRLTPRIFIAEFDFKDFFGSINHEYIFAQLKENAFLVSPTEEHIIRAFISDKDVGIPLGTSISLFIANVVCWKLDRALENEGLRFARYADDTIIWSSDYGKICKAFDIINEFSIEASIKINYKKSHGISILQRPEMPSEFNNTKESIEFLGYEISADYVGMKRRSEARIKKQIAYLLYKNLVYPIKGKPFRGVNFPSNGTDKDLLRAIMQIRRYLYGNLTETSLAKYINGTHARLNFKGIMSFYPLIDHDVQLKALDRWLVSTILNTLSKRRKLFLMNGYSVPQGFPFNMTPETLLRQCKVMMVSGKKGLMEIPSFLRIHRAIKKGLTHDGIERVMNAKSRNYHEA